LYTTFCSLKLLLLNANIVVVAKFGAADLLPCHIYQLTLEAYHDIDSFDRVGAKPGRARSDDLAGRSTALAPPCLLLYFASVTV